MHVGVAHHFGWAVVVTTSADLEVVDRRRIELIESGTPTAPVHTDGVGLDDAALEDLIARVRDSARRATGAALDELAADLGQPVVSMSLRDWPDDFPTEVATMRRPPHEARADSVMYREVLAGCADARGWTIHRFDARAVEGEATALLGERAEEVLYGTRRRLGPPWARDHRMAAAATIVAALSP